MRRRVRGLRRGVEVDEDLFSDEVHVYGDATAIADVVGVDDSRLIAGLIARGAHRFSEGAIRCFTASNSEGFREVLAGLIGGSRPVLMVSLDNIYYAGGTPASGGEIDYRWLRALPPDLAAGGLSIAHTPALYYSGCGGGSAYEFMKATDAWVLDLPFRSGEVRDIMESAVAGLAERLKAALDEAAHAPSGPTVWGTRSEFEVSRAALVRVAESLAGAPERARLARALRDTQPATSG